MLDDKPMKRQRSNIKIATIYSSYALRHQRGVATILVVLMVSLAMMVAAIGVIYSLRGAQDIQVAAHAKTHSQASAWAGVEVFRRYLYELSADPAALEALAGSLDMSIATSSAVLSAEIVNVVVPVGTSPTETFDITANIRSYDQAAKSTSVVQVMYRVAPFLCSDNIDLNGTLDFHRDLSMGGNINIQYDPGASSSFFVDGNISLGSISAAGVGVLYSTGDVFLGSGVYIPEVHANGNLTLEGSAAVGRAYAVGTLSTDGSAKVIAEGNINGTVTLNGGANGVIRSLADVNVTSWISVGEVNTSGSFSMVGGDVGAISVQGDVTITGGNSVGDVVSESDVSCPSWWTNYTSIQAAGSISGCGYDPLTPGSVPATPGATVSVSVMSPVEAFSMEPVKVDAWALKNEANYVFQYDGQMRVTVQNINSVVDGQYYIVVYNQTNYLCETLDAGGACTNPSPPVLNICNGHSANNTCFDYDESSATWMFDGKNMAPGAVWVEGNLHLGNGYYYNSFIATGDIETASAHKTQAINFAGYDPICANQFPVNASNRFDGLYPKNFCDTDNGVLKDNAVGNFGLLAGGYNPNHGGAYEGGDITLGASTEIFGTVMAGDYLFTGGDTTIHGYISASGLGVAQAGVSNSLGGSTTVDLRSLPSTYNPSLIPNMDASLGNCGAGHSDVSKTYWTKYL